jgi:hypothetical protein
MYFERKRLHRARWAGLVWLLVLPVFLSSCFGFGMPYTGPQGASAETVPDYNPGNLDTSAYRNGRFHPRLEQIDPELNRAVFRDPAGKLPELVAALTGDVADEFVKVKIIHDWISLNLRYDLPAFKSGRIPPQDAYTVLKTGKAVCEGYAAVFKVMCGLAKIQAVTIPGYGRGVSFDIMNQDEKIHENHAWNAVRIKEGWYLLDVTWDSNYYRQTNKYSQVFLFTAPAVMVNSHFPTDPKWQLLTPPMSGSAFITMASLSPDFYFVFNGFPTGLKKRTIVSGEYTFTLPPVKPGYHLFAHLTTAAELKELAAQGQITCTLSQNVMLEQLPDKTLVRVRLPEKGIYRLDFAWVPITEDLSWVTAHQTVCAMLTIENRKGDPRRFPRIAYDPPGFRLLEPLYSPLVEGKEVSFHVIVPGCKELYVGMGDGKGYRHVNAGAGGEFRFTVIPSPLSENHTVYICYKFKETNATILLYDIQPGPSK